MSGYEPRVLAGSSVVCGIQVCGAPNGPSLRNPSQHRWGPTHMLLYGSTLTLDSGLYLSLSPYFVLLGPLDICLIKYILFLRAGTTFYSLQNAARCWLVPRDLAE